MLNIGILPFARPTFDVELANTKLEAMLAALEAKGYRSVGPRSLLMGGEDGEAAIRQLQQANIDEYYQAITRLRREREQAAQKYDRILREFRELTAE